MSKLDRDDAVKQPAHYLGDAVYEPHKVLEEWLTPEQFIGYCRGQAIVYLMRADRKGQCDEDLGKAAYYAERERDFRRRLAEGKVGEARVPDLVGAATSSEMAYRDCPSCGAQEGACHLGDCPLKRPGYRFDVVGAVE